MTSPVRRSLAHVIRDAARPLTGAREDFDPVMALVGDARVVLIGEASHGTHEFYRIRAEITKRLIRERGFVAVAAEADWPDAYRVNRYVRGTGTDADASEALGGFRRFPQWMWRNADVLDFVGWLREFNDQQPDVARKVGFYGLDLYSLHASMAAVLEYLRVVDPAAAKRAQYRYACFEQFGEDPQAYGYAASYGLAPSCEREVVEQLVDLRRSAADYAQRDGRVAADDLFFTEQNARVVRNAERYYRSMFGSRVQSWNLRDQHMTDTLQALVSFLDRSSLSSKVVVWAHNSHVGDARATELGAGGELNVGQLARQQFGAEIVTLGFTTYRGTVTAASDWDAPAERKVVRPALPESYEAVFHDAPRNFFLDLRAPSAVATTLDDVRIERAIGVIYRPETERLSHYFSARLSRQFDGILHYDETRAVEPLERTGVWNRGEVPETFPTAL
ncbi:MAG TPA: erythromycin esterase family protein [Gemmatimonadaceae bacterium]|nr:erythromycin esterase family protein [Gemmatimonadaceae bacterium]